MTDREKVIKGLEYLSEWLFQQYQVVYDGDASNYYDAYKTVDDAIALLKEQETTYAYNEYTNPACTSCGFRPFAGYIPTLKWMQERGYRYCPGCGKAVKWDD